MCTLPGGRHLFINLDRCRMNSLIEEIYRTQQVRDANGNTRSIVPASIFPNEGKALYQLVRRTKAKQTLEIGLAYGLSTLFLCQAHIENQQEFQGEDTEKPCHTAVDPFQASYWHNIGLLNLERAGFRHLVHFHEQKSQVLLPQLLDKGKSYDFAFIDGAHLFDYVFLDFWYVDQLIKPDGLIMLHDLIMPAIRKLLSFVLRNYNYVVDPAYHDVQVPPWRKLARLARMIRQHPTEVRGWSLPFTHGPLDLYARNYCVLRKVGEDERDWNHYSPF